VLIAMSASTPAQDGGKKFMILRGAARIQKKPADFGRCVFGLDAAGKGGVWELPC